LAGATIHIWGKRSEGARRETNVQNFRGTRVEREQALLQTVRVRRKKSTGRGGHYWEKKKRTISNDKEGQVLHCIRENNENSVTHHRQRGDAHGEKKKKLAGVVHTSSSTTGSVFLERLLRKGKTIHLR